MKILHPEVFQGDLRQRRYFEGWYLKHVSADGQHVLSVIPGVALTDEDPHGFIQVLNGMTGQSWNIRFPLSECDLSTSAFDVRIGQSTFSPRGIHLEIDRPELTLTGDLRYDEMVRFPSTVWKPGIMGPFTFVPRMECKHGVVSIRHALHGQLRFQDTTLTFDRGTGYIEKDWGTSFPEAWIWVQANTFAQSDASFMFSIAKVPWLGRSFVGFLSFFYVHGRLHLFTSYQLSKLVRLSYQDQSLTLELANATHVLRANVQQKTSGHLKAPVIGKMDRMIKESVDSEIALELKDRRGNVMYAGSGTHAGLEVIEELFRYLPQR